MLGTKFTVYDGGENPEKKPFVKESESVRQELVAICYVSQIIIFYSQKGTLSPSPSMDTYHTPTFIDPMVTEKYLHLYYNPINYHVPGKECSRFQRTKKNDGYHPWHAGE